MTAGVKVAVCAPSKQMGIAGDRRGVLCTVRAWFARQRDGGLHATVQLILESLPPLSSVHAGQAGYMQPHAACLVKKVGELETFLGQLVAPRTRRDVLDLGMTSLLRS